MFYAAEALLLQIGLFFSRHSAVIAEFNRSFIQTRIVDERHFRAIRDGFNERAVGDYDYREDVPPEQSERTIRRA
ncbi:MAG: HEPN domain-containing protein, partial [Candidatus Rokubacteria bacterium]|nr:HEPN domain-containing protein [Candidatus Rokubacteria bacterium]